jgi:hypothetical protein
MSAKQLGDRRPGLLGMPTLVSHLCHTCAGCLVYSRRPCRPAGHLPKLPQYVQGQPGCHASASCSCTGGHWWRKRHSVHRHASIPYLCIKLSCHYSSCSQPRPGAQRVPHCTQIHPFLQQPQRLHRCSDNNATSASVLRKERESHRHCSRGRAASSLAIWQARQGNGYSGACCWVGRQRWPQPRRQGGGGGAPASL